jgi:LuxR family transcriptional regulator, activator of conjugal transfer of Ti plasmids
MQKVFEAFLDRLTESVDDVDLRGAMAAAASELDLRMFAYLLLPSQPADRPRLISNYPARWTSHYLRNHYQKVDPVILHAQCGGCPFRWGSVFGRNGSSPTQQQLFDEAAEFGICCGLTIPVVDRRGDTAAMTFAADERDPAFLRVADRYEQALQLMATCFSRRAASETFGGLPPEKWSSLRYGFRADGGLKEWPERDTVRKRSLRSCGRLTF